MRSIAVLCLAVLLVMGGCPSQQEIPSAVTVLAAGTYTGPVDCTSKATGRDDQQAQTTMTVEVTEAGQLYISSLPYYEGVIHDMSDAANGVTGSITINTITEDTPTKTVTIAGSGTLGNASITYATTHDITLVQASDTQMDVTDVYAGQSTSPSSEFEFSCGGTLTKQ